MKMRFDQKGKYFTDVVSKDSLPAVIQTNLHRIHGLVYVRSGSRLKDELNLPEQFLAITQAAVYDDGGNLLYETDFIAVNRDSIVWIIPELELQDEPGEDGSDS